MKGVVPRVQKEPEPEQATKVQARSWRRKAVGLEHGASLHARYPAENASVRPPTQNDGHQPVPELTTEERELLESILAEPRLSVTERGARLGISTNKMNEWKKSVLQKGLADQFTVNRGKEHGGNVTLLALTMEGYGVLGKLPANKRPDNVTPKHWYLQTEGCAHFKRQGIEAEIEKNLNGKRADIGVNNNGRLTAIEFELSPNNAIPNIVQDLDAGFDKVVSICQDRLVAREVSRRLALYEGYEGIKDRVEVRVLSELQLVKDLCAK